MEEGEGRRGTVGREEQKDGRSGVEDLRRTTEPATVGGQFVVVNDAVEIVVR